jgi:hypothetical protein
VIGREGSGCEGVLECLFLVMPAKAGIQSASLDPRLGVTVLRESVWSYSKLLYDYFM